MTQTLQDLLDQRDEYLNQYYLTDNLKWLGMYNGVVSDIELYLLSNDIEYTKPVDTYRAEYGFLTHEHSIDEEPLDISTIDTYNLDFEID